MAYDTFFLSSIIPFAYFLISFLLSWSPPGSDVSSPFESGGAGPSGKVRLSTKEVAINTISIFVPC